MATYVPNPTDTAEPLASRSVESAAAEFRALKSRVLLLQDGGGGGGGDSLLRADLAAASGSSLLGHLPAGSGALPTTVQTALRGAVTAIAALETSVAAATSNITTINSALTALTATVNSITVAASPFVPVVIFAGESNSGGYALNTDLTAAQLAARPAVQILNNTSLVFESLDIGTNNLIGHTGLTANATHGWENGLATSVESGTWNYPSVYLIKTGQGGSVISEWGTTGAYFSTLTARINAAYAIIKAAGKQPLPFIWYTQGINDAIANTSVATWKAATKVHFTNLRALIGFAPIITPEFMSGRDAYTAALNEIANEYPFVFIASSLSAGLRDTNHWNAAGMALLASRMATIVTTKIGTASDPYTLAAVLAVSRYSATTISNPPTLPQGAITFTDVSNAVVNASTGELQNTGALPSGGRDTYAVNATAAFKYEWDVPATGGYTDTVVVILDDTATSNYNWSSMTGEPYLSGIYANADGNIYISITAGTNITNFARPAVGVFRMKAEKSGNNLVYSWSLDGGTTWTVLYTHTNRLTSVASAYIKVLFATADASKKINLRKFPF